MGLYNYHDKHGSFPPAYLADATGKPIHSWRVLILPYLDDSEGWYVYRSYRFNEPWDGPNNRKLHSVQVRAYQCPSDDIQQARPMRRTANCVAVVGDLTMWPGAKPVKIADIKDSTSQTVALVEMIDSGIHWMEPRDLSFDEMSFEINDPARVSISSGHGSAQGESSTHGAQVAFADGSIFFLQDGVSPTTVRALLTRNGGEKIEELDLYPPKQSGK